jgi:dipeptidyl aminopeptidase/acylaminoacyl peptidase
MVVSDFRYGVTVRGVVDQLTVDDQFTHGFLPPLEKNIRFELAADP